ncbi:phosphoribosylamine--glycine ligase [Kallotenue papyrolyticum]|uniref:phosphoribosylamine--glycine ligase n=1 Tax=Kallotenue papyrolyticum TaxID=1325125 RepID=UPI00047864DE|nr:phosphoribosylamine--glycine ligase [Kallotenue papyrolyticum]
MKIMIVGGGGREHAIAWKLSQSPRVRELVIAPGNAGTAQLGRNVAIKATDLDAQVALAQAERPDLVVVAPDDPLALGLVDRLTAAGVRAWGPSAAAARIEASKALAKEVMRRAGIPTADYTVVDSYEQGERYVRAQGRPLVVKADGLALGKGVIVAETVDETLAALRRMLREGAFGAAGARVVLEERLSGEEISLLGFCDGRTVVPLLPSQDHKRLLDGDRGPNTGGMGAYAPVSRVDRRLAEQLTATILQPAVDALREMGTPFVGVLYAGLMLTAEGPRVLEFNARFGDPETQALLPLLESDLLEIMLASLEAGLHPDLVRWHADAAVCVVLAAQGYPEQPRRGDAIALPEALPEQTLLFHAGTARQNGQLVTAGGRVLNAVGLGETFATARARAYALAERIHFAGKQMRYDIGARELAR